MTSDIYSNHWLDTLANDLLQTYLLIVTGMLPTLRCYVPTGQWMLGIEIFATDASLLCPYGTVDAGY
jgi:hypothetical protein